MKKIKIVLALACIWFSSGLFYAQVGIDTATPAGALDVFSSTDGLLIPRVALVNTTTVTVITGTTSELVYNTATINDVTPGFYYLSTATGPWIRLATGASGWLTTGNTGIIDGTNFIGTAAATNVDVAFRRNNLPSGKIGLTSTSFGLGALNAGALSNSTAFGTNALTLTTGVNNVAVGNGTLAANTTGIQNTGVGNAALSLNTGSASTAVGFEALRNNTGGNNGTAVGFRALSSNTLANNNSAIGFETMLSNTIGNENTAVGFQASRANLAGNKNTSMGFIALNNNQGSENTAIGHSSMSAINNMASRFNTAIGFQSMFAGTGNVSNVVAVGANALFQNTASNTTAVGFNALQGQQGLATGNTGVGFSVLNNNTTGDNNTAIGSEAGFAAVGNGNTLIGYRAGQFASNATGAGTFVGFQAGLGTTGANNTVVGHNALVATGASANNVAMGNNVLNGNISTNNTAVGSNALVSNIGGSGNVALGNQAGFSETGSNKLYISNSITTPITSLVYGEFSPTPILRTNSTFQIGNPAGTGYVFPVARGTANQYLASDASGVLSWVSPNGTNTLSTIRTNINANQVLTTAGWQLIRTNINANQVLTTAGWQLVTFNTVVIDTNTEFAANRFTATRAGIYEINAGYHTDNQSNAQFYSIGVYVNGVLYQQNTMNHVGVGPVSRTVNCIVNIAIGDYVEIYAENYQAFVQIDSFSGKTYFEVRQVR